MKSTAAEYVICPTAVRHLPHDSHCLNTAVALARNPKEKQLFGRKLSEIEAR